MTKTYGEMRQAAYFAAARDLYKLVVLIADENIDNPPEGTNVTDANKIWAASLIETTFAKAFALETLGHEETPASTRTERQLARVRETARARTGEGRALKAKILAQIG